MAARIAFGADRGDPWMPSPAEIARHGPDGGRIGGDMAVDVNAVAPHDPSAAP